MSAAFGDIVVKLWDSSAPEEQDDPHKYLKELTGAVWVLFAPSPPDLFHVRRLFRSVSPIGALAAQAELLDPTYHAPNFLSYFLLTPPPGVPLQALADALVTVQEVELAYPDLPAQEPAVMDPSTNRFYSEQEHHKAKPDGIGSSLVWPVPEAEDSSSLVKGYANGDGDGVLAVVIERGFQLDHEDLVAQPIWFDGIERPGSVQHGTFTLGVVCAEHNGIGVIGIAPKIKELGAVSWHKEHRADVITKVLAGIAPHDALRFGDVLLLEIELNPNKVLEDPLDEPIEDPNLAGLKAAGYPYLPLEALDADFQAIRLAVALGVVVIEPAGNGDCDLDCYLNVASGVLSGDHTLRRLPASEEYRESGAIMVAAAEREDSAWSKGETATNFGTRVDCFAAGNGIDTTDTVVHPDLYDKDELPIGPYGVYNSTSGASAIVAGAAIVLQAMCDAVGARLSPTQMRQRLADASSGTVNTKSKEPDPETGDQIGVMPNLFGLASSLGLGPDLYLRDHVGDDGTPHTGSVSSSPDVILRKEEPTSAELAKWVGEKKDLTGLGEPAKGGEKNYVYVRAWNRGSSEAANVTVTVYWSKPSTLVHYEIWKDHLVGQTTIASVPMGSNPVLSPAIEWDTVPSDGHYCFVAFISHGSDPAPPAAEFAIWDNFVKFVRLNNNVTWKNFDVVDSPSLVLPKWDPEFDYWEVDFWAPGPPDRARTMALELSAQLPRGARIVLEAPARLLPINPQDWRAAGLHARWRDPRVVAFDAIEGRTTMRLNPQGTTTLARTVFPARSNARLRLFVHLPKSHRKSQYEVFVRHLWEGQELGRITWLFGGLRGEKAAGLGRPKT